MRGAAVTLDIVLIVVTTAVDLTKRRVPYRSIPSSRSLGGSTVISPILQMRSLDRGGVAACPRMSPGLSDSRAHSLHWGPFAAWCSRGVALPRGPWSGTTQDSEAGTPAFRRWPMAL